MFTQTLLPSHPALKNFVKYYWVMIGDEPDGNPSMLPPVSDFDLVFSFGAGTTWTMDHMDYHLDETFLCGGRSKTVYIRAKGKIHYLSVTFHPWGLYPFLGIPLSEMREEPVEIGLLPLEEWHICAEKLETVQELSHKVNAIENLLIRQLNRVKVTENKSMERVISIIQQSDRQYAVSALANKTGIPNRKMERDFLKWTGLSPKRFMRVERVTKVFRRICEPGFNGDWFDLIDQYGYHDQAHLIHEFKAMMDLTPEEFLFDIQHHPETFAR